MGFLRILKDSIERETNEKRHSTQRPMSVENWHGEGAGLVGGTKVKFHNSETLENNNKREPLLKKKNTNK